MYMFVIFKLSIFYQEDSFYHIYLVFHITLL